MKKIKQLNLLQTKEKLKNIEKEIDQARAEGRITQ